MLEDTSVNMKLVQKANHHVPVPDHVPDLVEEDADLDVVEDADVDFEDSDVVLDSVALHRPC